MVSTLTRGLGLSIRQPRRDGVRGVARQLAIGGKGELALDYRRMQARRRRDHSRIVLRECDNEEALTLQLERGLGETPGIEYEFTHVESGRERADVIDGLEHAAITVINRRADLEPLVHPHDRGR
jgi:hypothetical protein